jgi:hypothetical protein
VLQVVAHELDVVLAVASHRRRGNQVHQPRQSDENKHEGAQVGNHVSRNAGYRETLTSRRGYCPALEYVSIRPDAARGHWTRGKFARQRYRGTGHALAEDFAGRVDQAPDGVLTLHGEHGTLLRL